MANLQAPRAGSRVKKPSQKAIEAEPVQRKARRTPAEVTQAKELARLQKEVKATKKEATIDHLAMLEDRMATDVADTDSAHPRHYNDKDTQQGSVRSREATDSEAELPPKKKRATKARDDSLAKKRKHVEESEEDDTILPSRQRPKDAPPKSRPISNTTNAKTNRKTETGRTTRSATTQIAEATPKHGRSHHEVTTMKNTHHTPPAEILDLSSDTETTDSDHTPPRKIRAIRREGAFRIRTHAKGKVDEGDESSEEDKTPTPRKVMKEKEKMELGTWVSGGGRRLPRDTTSEPETDTETEPESTPKAKKVKIPMREAVKAKRMEKAVHRQEHVSVNTMLSNSVKNDAGVRSSVENASQPSISTKARTVKYDSRRASAPHSAYTTSSNGIAITSNPLPTSAPHSKACTTTSESLPVMQPAVTVEYGGFSEEDESEERQAALSSPIKGKQLLSSSSLVKIEEPEPRYRVRKEKYTNADLPAGSLDQWRKSTIPCYYLYIGGRDDVWSVNDRAVIDILQKIWDFVYGARIPHIVSSPGAVFYIADQRLCEWRNTFGSAAITFLQALFETTMEEVKVSNDSGSDSDSSSGSGVKVELRVKYNTDNKRKEYARGALDHFVFLYGYVRRDKHGEIIKRKLGFQTPLVLQTFASHIISTRNKTEVPNIDLGLAYGALALSAAAVERALKLWKDGHITCESTEKAKIVTKPRTGPIIKTLNSVTGKESTKSTDFNQTNWGNATGDYLRSAKKNLNTEEKFKVIVKLAKVFAKRRHRAVTEATPVKGDQERGSLLDDSDTDDGDDVGGDGSDDD